MDLLFIILTVLISIIFILLGITYYSISNEEKYKYISKEDLIQCLLENKEKFKILIKKIE